MRALSRAQRWARVKLGHVGTGRCRREGSRSRASPNPPALHACTPCRALLSPASAVVRAARPCCAQPCSLCHDRGLFVATGHQNFSVAIGTWKWAIAHSIFFLHFQISPNCSNFNTTACCTHFSSNLKSRKLYHNYIPDYLYNSQKEFYKNPFIQNTFTKMLLKASYRPPSQSWPRRSVVSLYTPYT